MSFASGFFNSVDHDRLYDATDISRLFDGLIRDGIFASIGDCFVVKQSNQMNVTVGTGRAWFNHTWSYNDALYPVTIPPSEILMDRIDAIVLEINSVESVRANSIKLIKGTPASTPTKPVLTNTKEVHQYPLAYVKVGKEVTSIRQADIENCVGTSVCPFVTGILEVISIEQLIPQWRDILNRFVEENTANFNTWMNGEKQDYQAWLTAAKKEITDWQATSKSDYQEWYDSIKNGYDQWFATIKAAYDANWSTFQQWEQTSQAEFDTWFENMKNKLEGDLGAKLTLEAEKLGKEKVSLIESTKTDLVGTVEAPLMLNKATRNFFHKTIETQTQNGITCTNNGDGTYTLNGTASKQATFILAGTDDTLAMFKGHSSLKLVGFPKKYASAGVLQVWRQSDNLIMRDRGDGVIITGSNMPYGICNMAFVIYDGAVTDGMIIKPMITTDLNATYDDFVPYSGYEIKTCGKNLLNLTKITTNTAGATASLSNGIITLDGPVDTSGEWKDLWFNTVEQYVSLKRGVKYTISTKDKVQKVFLMLRNNRTEIAYSHDCSTNGTTFVASQDMICRITVTFKEPSTFNNTQIAPQIEVGEKATEYEHYQDGGTAHIDSSTEFPNFDLKSFDGATHIISPGNVQSFHADAPNGKYLLESIKKSAESGGVSYGATEPTNPKPGDLWINPASGGRIQYWTGSKWDVPRALDANGSDVVKSNIKPSSKRSTLWIDSGNGNAMKHVAEDGTVTELSSGGTYYGASAPTNTKLLWIDTSGVARFYNGSAWATLTPTWG